MTTTQTPEPTVAMTATPDTEAVMGVRPTTEAMTDPAAADGPDDANPSGSSTSATPSGSEEAPREPDEELDKTFPREYVEKLRKEAADYRTRAKDRDDLAHRLHDALVAATGRLADPSDLAFDEQHLDDAEALQDAIDTLLAAKPHLASRRVHGDIGQGVTNHHTTTNLAALLRANA